MNQDAPLLIAQNGPLQGERWTLDHALVLGRDPGCDIVIPERQVSRFHARLIPSLNGMIVEDLGSKNGTQRNGASLTAPTLLEDGDVLQIALVQEFQFVNSDATMPLEAPRRSGVLTLDLRSRQVWLRGHLLTPSLSAQQFHLLWTLYQSPGEVLPRAALIEAVWGAEQAAGVSEQALDALLRRLRDRLAELDPQQTYLVTLRGHGIRLDNPQE